jgi:hypothetical protein
MFLLLQCHAPLSDPPCLPLGIKDLLKEAFGFWMKAGFLMWETLEGQRIAEGKKKCWREIAEGENEWLKGEELLKENC